LSGYIPFGDWRASAELMQSSGSASVIEAVSNCRGLFPGGKFTLAGHGTADGEYLVISVRQEGTQAVDHSSGQTQRFSFRNRFECVPFASAPFFRQPRITRKPAVHGCQTALVIGPNGEEIWTDKYGRVRVQFPWDTGTLGSCWVRVGTSWAGSQWGSLHVPRVGQEVIVSFLDGDPDRPIVVGSVYNANMMPRYDLPSEKSLSGLVSRSTPGGSQATFNEIRFDDTKGSEQIVVHAQKDQFEVVENNSHRIVGNDDMSDIGGNQSANVAGNRHEKIGGVFSLEATDEIHLKAKKIVIEAESISLRTPGGGSDEFLYLEKGGGITIDSKGNHVWLNCGGAGSPDDGTAANPTAPTDPYATGSQG
jgi:type VI secretion system secreted protein VgrG